MSTELFNVLTPADALARLREALAGRPAAEIVEVAAALDRVLADDVPAPGDLPAFPRSTMDGYAVRARDTFGATEGLPAYLTVTGEAAMGVAPAIEVGSGRAVTIHTGGMVPSGADAVVMIENTQPVDATTIEVVRAVAPGENVIQVGEDVRADEIVLPAGHVLRPQDLGGLLGVGVTRVVVTRRPRVALLSTGDEIVSPEVEPRPGQVRDVNSYALSGMVYRSGAVPVTLGIVGDDYPELLAAAQRGLAENDVLVISAGSSVSTRDLTAQVIGELGQPGVLVHGVSLKPGKPTILAVAGGKPVFGLPGNPVSAMITFDAFVRPALYWLQGCAAPPNRQTVRARLTKNVASAPGREDYVQVRLEPRDGELWAEPVFGKSNLIYTLIRADGMLRVPLDALGLPAGEPVDVTIF